ncbi:hypothetical protein N9324_00510 [Candidatus Pelagibacter sp.]|nr:hypothetical protein [Candidatus Pelagibacter sp.]
MNNLDIKLNELEDKVVSERLRKADLRKRVELRERKIHSEYIKKWNSGVLNNKTFINDLNKIQTKFKKINSKDNRYSWMFYAADISSKERVKDEVAFYLNFQKVSLQLSLSGIYSEVILSNRGEYKIEELNKAKEEYLDEILEAFKEQN